MKALNAISRCRSNKIPALSILAFSDHACLRPRVSDRALPKAQLQHAAMQPCTVPLQAQQQAAAELLQLPPDVVYRIWAALRHPYNPHALRCTCKQLRNMSDAWITKLRIDIELPPAPESQTEAASQQVMAFPGTAVVRKLALWQEDAHEYERVVDEEDVAQLAALDPDLLLNVLLAHRERFKFVTRLDLRWLVGLTYGDFACIAKTCPALHELHVRESYVRGPALAALADLPSLSSLGLESCWTKPDADPVLEPLPRLCHLTSLHLDDNVLFGPTSWLPSLTALRSLQLCPNLVDQAAVPGYEEAWGHIRSLTLLTHLAFKGWSVPAHRLRDLACVPGLVSLRLPDRELCSPTFHALASLPSLRELQARRSNPDTDLRHLHCCWTKLTLAEVRSPTDVAWLPVHGLRQLQLPHTLTFGLEAGGDKDTTFALVQQAASAITAMAHEGLLVVNRIAVCLQWDTIPQQPCSQLLAALAPLGHRLSSLTLQNWPLVAEDVAVGAKHLPHLQELAVGLQDLGYPGIPGFLQALEEAAWPEWPGVTLPWHVVRGTSEQIKEAVRRLDMKRANKGKR